MSEMMRDTCIWYRGCTWRVDAVGSGHNCSPFGCLSKETCGARGPMSDTTVARLNLHQHKAKIMKFLRGKSRQTGWILTGVKASVTERTIGLLSHRHTTAQGNGEKRVVDGTSTKPQSQKYNKDQELGCLVNTRISYWALAWFESWMGPFMSTKLSHKWFVLGHHDNTTFLLIRAIKWRYKWKLPSCWCANTLLRYPILFGIVFQCIHMLGLL